MSRAGLYGSLFAAVAAALVVSCGRDQGLQTVNTEGAVHIVFACGGNNVTVGLVGDNGRPAWKAEREQGKPIAWVVQQHVTINSIKLKTGGAIPVSVTSNPNGPGTPLEGTVTGNPGTTYPYNIDVTCQQNGNTVRLVIDPEMIVRPGP